ncbi:unnamed protein product [Alternaria alternata]
MFKHYRTPSPADECPDIFFDRESKRPRRTDPTPVARTQRNLSVGDLRQLLTIWDFTMNPSQQPEAAVDRAATIIFSGILMFPDEEQRRETIWDQVHQRLVQLLFIHGLLQLHNVRVVTHNHYRQGRLLEILPAGNESAAARQRRETSARAHIAKAERTMAELQAWVSEAVESERNVLAQINNNPEVHVASRKEAEFRLRWAME